MSIADFQDIVITGIDRTKTQEDANNEDLYILFFTLSSAPPDEWIKLLKDSVNLPEGSSIRNIGIQGTSLLLTIDFQLLANKALFDNNALQPILRGLRTYVRETNEKYRLEQGNIENRKNQAMKRLNELLDNLEF
jgi:hypothetical protein